MALEPEVLTMLNADENIDGCGDGSTVPMGTDITANGHSIVRCDAESAPDAAAADTRLATGAVAAAVACAVPAT